ncbi:hypothetical protein BN863_21090, partial [Formosa agariphila KMM 3901]
VQDFQSNKVLTSKGWALVLVESFKGKTGTVIINATSPTFKSNSVDIQMQ